jgi:hypothetical protein
MIFNILKTVVILSDVKNIVNKYVNFSLQKRCKYLTINPTTVFERQTSS